MKKETLTLRFQGENDIDIQTLSKSLNSMVQVLETISESSLGDGDFCKFKVKNIERGSFVITIEQILEVAATLFPVMPPILESLNSIIELRKNLGGQLPDQVKHEGDNVIVKSKNGAAISINNSTFNMYVNHPSIEKGLAAVSKTVSEDVDRMGFVVETTSNSKTRVVEMSSEDLVKTKKPLDVEALNEDITEEFASGTLTVKKPDLLGESKWQFVFLGKTIDADIADEKFLEKVRNKEISFPVVSKLKANMKVKLKRGEPIKYTITEVLSYE